MTGIEITTTNDTILSGIRAALKVPYLDASGDIYVGGIVSKIISQVDFDTYIPSNGEIVSVYTGGTTSLPLIGNGTSVINDLFFPVTIRSLSLTGDFNTHSGRGGLVVGKSLNDSGLNYAYMLGSGKTASTASAVYLQVDNGVRLKPVGDTVTNVEDGTFWITTGGDLRFRASGITHSFKGLSGDLATFVAADITDSSAAGRALITGADASAQRTSLALGSAAVLNTGTGASQVVIGNDPRLGAGSGGSIIIGDSLTGVLSISSAVLSGIDAGGTSVAYWNDTDNKVVYGSGFFAESGRLAPMGFYKEFKTGSFFAQNGGYYAVNASATVTYKTPTIAGNNFIVQNLAPSGVVTINSIPYTGGGGLGGTILDVFIPTDSASPVVRQYNTQIIAAEVSETLTNKSLANPLLYGFREATNSTSSGTSLILTNILSTTFVTVTMTGNCTVTMPTAIAGASFTIKVITAATPYTLAFTGVKWAGNVTPTFETTNSRYYFVTFVADGTNWSGVVSETFYV